SDLAVSLPREIDDIQIVLTNNCLCFRGVQSPLNNDRIALEGHVFVLFGAAPPRNLRAVRVRAVGEEQVSAKSTQMASPKRLRGIFEHRTILDLSAVIWEPTLDELEGVRSRELPFSLEIPGDVCPASVSAEEGTISYHLEVLLEMARDSQADTDTNAASSPTPTTRSSIKSPSLLTLLGAVADFRVQRLPTISEMKNHMEPFATSTAHVSCVTTGSRLLLAHEAAAGVYMSVSPCRVSLQIISSAGPYQINKIVASLVEQTVFTGRKRSLVTKMQKNSTKSYTRTRDVLGEREIGGDAVGTLVVLDLCDLSAATSLNQDALSTHVAVTHHLALDVHCDKQEGSLQLRIPILVAFS
ncbi:hypothetical protein BC831DRAFT_395274, partial [Entophlyctis helioformis]